MIAVLAFSLPETAGQIRGRVTDPGSNAGIAGALVVLDEGPMSTTADEEGRFLFDGVAAGTHRVSASVSGFSRSVPVEVLVTVEGEVSVEIVYPLRVSTEVRGAGEQQAASRPLGGRTMLRGRDVASTVGGLDDIGRVLQMQPGVVASQDDRNDLLVRGGGALETQVVVDGFELPTASHFGASGSSSGGISLIPSDVIDRATLETSGFGAAHGERASSLVRIDLRQRAGDGARVGGAASAGAGGVLGLIGGPAPRDGGWMVSARRSVLETAFSRGNARAVPRYADAFGHLAMNLAAGHQLRLLVLGARDGADVEPIQSARVSAIRDDQRLALVGMGVRSAWTETTSTSVSASFSTNEVDAYRTTTGVIDGRELSREGELRLRAEAARAIGRGAEVSAGVTFRRTAVSFDLQDTAYRNEFGSYIPPLRSRWHDRVTEPAVFGEASVGLGRGLRAVAGLRVERPGMSRAWLATPRLRLQWQAANRVHVTGSWGVYRQSVPFVWIASSADNAALAPIRCTLGTLGADVRGPWGLRFAAEGFVKRYVGYPIDPAEPPRVLISAGADFDVPFVGRLVGSGLVRSSGLDLSVGRRIGTRAELSAGYSHWRVVQRGLDQQWRPSEYDIRHQARVTGSVRPGGNWSASASWRFASGRPYTPFDAVASTRAGAGRYDRKQTNAVRYSAYARLDARVERVFTPGRTVLTVFAEVENLTDHDNIYVYAWSRSARRPDPILQWGRMPVAGVRLEF